MQSPCFKFRGFKVLGVWHVGIVETWVNLELDVRLVWLAPALRLVVYLNLLCVH